MSTNSRRVTKTPKTTRKARKTTATPKKAAPKAARSIKATKEALVADICGIQKKHPNVLITRNFYREQSTFHEKDWQKFFARFSDFRKAAGLEDFIDQAARAKQDEALAEKTEVKGDNCVITRRAHERIKSLAQLIEVCEIDTDVWEVERWLCNKWEMGYVKRSSKSGTRDNSETVNDAGHEELFQVKAWLRIKRHSETEGYVQENAQLRSQVEKLRLKVRSESELTRRLAQNHFGFDDFLTGIKDVTAQLTPFSIKPTKVAPIPPRQSLALHDNHSEDAVLLISDTHYGERIRRDDSAGFQEVNLEVQGNRTGAVVKGAKEVLTLHRSMYPIKTLHIWFGGDIGNGDLHSAAFSNEINIIEQVHFATNMLRFLIKDLLALTEPDPKTGVIVVEKLNLLFTVGNHMRIDEKMPYKIQARRTFDWLIYQILIDEFRGHPKITIKEDLAPYIFQDIRGHRYMFCHGFQVGYKNSPDQQAKSMGSFMQLARSLFDSRQWRQENGLEGETFTRVCIGDIHVPVSFPRLKSNGSLSGQNELGVNWTLEPIPAGMQIFGVSDKHQETWSYFLDVTHVGKENPNAYADFARKYAKDHNA